MQHVQHVAVISILVFVYFKYLLRVALNLGLVEHAEHLLKSVVHIAMQKRNLHNNAIVGQTFHKRLFIDVGHDVSVIVKHVMIDIYYRFLDVSHLVPEEINSYHRVGKAFLIGFAHVVLVAVLGSEILAETQGLGVEPCLLQLYQNNAVLYRTAFAFTHCRRKIYAEHRQGVACGVAVFMWTHRHVDHFFLQQSRQYGLGYALVFHEIFEHGVVNRIGYMYNHNVLFCFIYKSR